MADESLLCSIPAGVYRIGDDSLPLSSPAHRVILAAFSISAAAVTNAEFMAFIEAGGYSNTLCWTQMGWRWQGFKQETQPGFWLDPAFNQPTQPVVGVSWYEAAAYARWLALETREPWRLPTEVEWEVAATPPRSPEDERAQLLWKVSPTLINTSECRVGHAWAAYGVGNRSWCGAWNLLGNVWEWTSSRWGRGWHTLEYEYPYNPDDGREELPGSYARIMRGGSYFDVLDEAHPANRGRYLPGARASNIGFRLVYGE